jgi:hypothetical protein
VKKLARGFNPGKKRQAKCSPLPLMVIFSAKCITGRGRGREEENIYDLRSSSFYPYGM